MANPLIIVESPAKAKTLGRFLGAKYDIRASMGHVRDLPKSTLGIDIEHAARAKPHAKMAIIRLMVGPVPLRRNRARLLLFRTIRSLPQWRNCKALTISDQSARSACQELENGCGKVCKSADYPVGGKLGRRDLGIAEVDCDDRDIGSAGGGDIGAGISHHDRPTYVSTGSFDRAAQNLRIGFRNAEGVWAANGCKAG